MDPDSLRLAIELLNQDAAEILERGHEQHVGDLTDARLAFQSQQEDLQQYAISIGDNTLADRIGQQRNAFTTAAAKNPILHTNSDRNRKRGHGRSHHGLGKRRRIWRFEATTEDDGTIGIEDDIERVAINEDVVGELEFEDDASRVENAPEDAEGLKTFDIRNDDDRDAILKKDEKEPRQIQCVACNEKIQEPELIKSPCAHEFCLGCAVAMFQLSLTDVQIFPPRCCGERIPISAIEGVWGEELVDRYNKMLTEFDDNDRVYCANARCSAYIPPDKVELNIGTCDTCNTRTCALCKKAEHEGECVDENEEAVLRMATAEGWKRCFKCHIMVELKQGCNHMTCRCGGQFCYVCGMEWKTCDCVLWDEERIIEQREHQRQARAIQALIDQAGLVNGRQRQALAWMQNAPRGCQHVGRLPRIDGPQRCEYCQEILVRFILECPECNMKICVRCRDENF